MKRNVLGGTTKAVAPPVQVRPVREHLPAEILAPMLAGARARGIADAYEMLGVGAVLLSDSGRVLHASDRACQLMRDMVSVTSDHLVGTNAEANAIIESLIGACLAGADGAAATVSEPESGRRISLRIVNVPQGQGDCVQLLKSVMAVSEI